MKEEKINKILETPVIEKYTAKEFLNFLNEYDDRKITLEISIEGSKKAVSSTISIKELKDLFNLHGEEHSIIANIANHVFEKFISYYVKEKEWGQNSKVPGLNNIMDDLEKLKENIVPTDPDISSTEALRRELIKNFNEEQSLLKGFEEDDLNTFK